MPQRCQRTPPTTATLEFEPENAHAVTLPPGLLSPQSQSFLHKMIDNHERTSCTHTVTLRNSLSGPSPQPPHYWIRIFNCISRLSATAPLQKVAIPRFCSVCRNLTTVTPNLSPLRFCCSLPLAFSGSWQWQDTDQAAYATRILVWPRDRLGSPSTDTSPQWGDHYCTLESIVVSVSATILCWTIESTSSQPHSPQYRAPDSPRSEELHLLWLIEGHKKTL